MADKFISKEPEKKEETPDFGVDLSKFSFANASNRVIKKDSELRQREAMRLIRCVISPNDENKQSYDGEIFCVRNKVFEGVKKYVPFRTPTHVPKILYNMIKNKKCQRFRREKNENGVMSVVKEQIDAYNITVLQPLTSEEFNAIRNRQLAEGKQING